MGVAVTGTRKGRSEFLVSGLLVVAVLILAGVMLLPGADISRNSGGIEGWLAGQLVGLNQSAPDFLRTDQVITSRLVMVLVLTAIFLLRSRIVRIWSRIARRAPEEEVVEIGDAAPGDLAGEANEPLDSKLDRRFEELRLFLQALGATLTGELESRTRNLETAVERLKLLAVSHEEAYREIESGLERRLEASLARSLQRERANLEQAIQSVQESQVQLRAVTISARQAGDGLAACSRKLEQGLAEEIRRTLANQLGRIPTQVTDRLDDFGRAIETLRTQLSGAHQSLAAELVGRLKPGERDLAARDGQLADLFAGGWPAIPAREALAKVASRLMILAPPEERFPAWLFGLLGWAEVREPMDVLGRLLARSDQLLRDRVQRRGPRGLQLQEWERLNQDASSKSLWGLRRLVERINRLQANPDLREKLCGVEKWLLGLTVYEATTAWPIVPEWPEGQAVPLSEDQFREKQLYARTSLRNRLLIPLIRLYQEIFEAHPLEAKLCDPDPGRVPAWDPALSPSEVEVAIDQLAAHLGLKYHPQRLWSPIPMEGAVFAERFDLAWYQRITPKTWQEWLAIDPPPQADVVVLRVIQPSLVPVAEVDRHLETRMRVHLISL